MYELITQFDVDIFGTHPSVLLALLTLLVSVLA